MWTSGPDSVWVWARQHGRPCAIKAGKLPVSMQIHSKIVTFSTDSDAESSYKAVCYDGTRYGKKCYRTFGANDNRTMCLDGTCAGADPVMPTISFLLSQMHPLIAYNLQNMHDSKF